jgi:hypothetical protein
MVVVAKQRSYHVVIGSNQEMSDNHSPNIFEDLKFPNLLNPGQP